MELVQALVSALIGAGVAALPLLYGLVRVYRMFREEREKNEIFEMEKKQSHLEIQRRSDELAFRREESRTKNDRERQEWLNAQVREFVSDLRNQLKVVHDDIEKTRDEHAKCRSDNAVLTERCNTLERRVAELEKR